MINIYYNSLILLEKKNLSKLVHNKKKIIS